MVVVIALTASILAYTGACLVRRHAPRFGLVDAPNHRSSHVQPTPRGGGFGIVFGAAFAGIWVCAMSSAPWPLWAALGLSLLIAVVGLWDDIRFVSVRLRLLVQLLACASLVGLFGQPFLLVLPFGIALSGAVVFVVLCLSGVWWINLFNFMDGIDGLAGAQAVFMLGAALGLALWIHPAVSVQPVWQWMVCLLAATLGFLWLNWPPAKIFMGDVGSTYIAVMIFFFALASVQSSWLSYPVWLVLGALFVTDATITLVIRFLRGEPVAQAHRSHAYQHLARRWHSHRRVTAAALAMNILWLAPLAAAGLIWPERSWVLVGVAYTPLLIVAISVGAGRADTRSILVLDQEAAEEV